MWTRGGFFDEEGNWQLNLRFRLGLFVEDEMLRRFDSTHLQAGRDCKIRCGGPLTLLDGSSARAARELAIEAGEIEAGANRTEYEQFSASAGVHFAVKEDQIIPKGIDFVQSESRCRTYQNALLEGGKQVTIHSVGKTTFEGVELESPFVKMEIGGDLTLVSMVDESYASSCSAALIEKDLSSHVASQRSKQVAEPTSIQAQELQLHVAGDLNLKGSNIQANSPSSRVQIEGTICAEAIQEEQIRQKLRMQLPLEQLMQLLGSAEEKEQSRWSYFQPFEREYQNHQGKLHAALSLPSEAQKTIGSISGDLKSDLATIRQIVKESRQHLILVVPLTHPTTAPESQEREWQLAENLEALSSTFDQETQREVQVYQEVIGALRKEGYSLNQILDQWNHPAIRRELHKSYPQELREGVIQIEQDLESGQVVLSGGRAHPPFPESFLLPTYPWEKNSLQN